MASRYEAEYNETGSRMIRPIDHAVCMAAKEYMELNKCDFRTAIAYLKENNLPPVKSHPFPTSR